MYEIRQSEVFTHWLDRLSDRITRKRIVLRLRQMENGNLGDWKSLGGGLYETRLHFGPGYRLYYAKIDHTVLLLAAGGEKSTQTFDIEIAREILKGLVR